MDWVWMAIFLLAVAGLAASIVQRRALHLFSREQNDLNAGQERIDESITSLQGVQDV